MPGMLEALLERLEGVAARLEAVEAHVGSSLGSPAVAGGVDGAMAGARGGAAAGGAAPGGAPAAPAASAALAAYDALMAGAVAEFATAAAKLPADSHAVKAAQALEKAFAAERGVVAAIVASKKPANPADIQPHLTPVAAEMEAANKLTMGKRTDYDNHVKAVAEFLNALSFVLFVEKGQGLSLPAPHVEECWQSAEFFANKILVQHRNAGPSGEPHVAYVKSLKDLSTALRDYVKAHHTTGPCWNPKGGDLKTFKAGGGAPAGGKSIPAPPPPPPPGFFDEPRAAAAPAAGSMNAVFGQLNQGSAVTSGLKKVTDDMKTKNRTDRTGAVPSGPAKPAGSTTTTKAAAPAVVRPPKFALEGGRKWCVEFQNGATDLVIDKCDMKQTVYLYKCEKSVLVIKGKVNGICMDQCKKTAVVFEDVVAQCEVVNCSGVEVQVNGSVPTIQIDNTSGVQVYLSGGEKSNNVSILTAKSSEINVLTKPTDGTEDMVEAPLPEQFVSTFDAKLGKWTTVAVAHSG